MKYVILVFFIICLNGCLEHESESPTKTARNGNISIVEIDSCEYVLLVDWGYKSAASGIVHHQNCKYCRQRSGLTKNTK